MADTIISPSSAYPTCTSPSRHAYLPGSLQFDRSNPSLSAQQIDPLLSKSDPPTASTIGGSSGRQERTVPWSTQRNSCSLSSPTRKVEGIFTPLEEGSRHSHIHESNHIRRENRPPNSQQPSLIGGRPPTSPRRNTLTLGLACHQLRNRKNGWRVPKIIQSLVPSHRNRNNDNSPLLNPDAIRGRRSLNMLEISINRDENDCFLHDTIEDDRNDPKRELRGHNDSNEVVDDDDEDDMASDSALVGSPLSSWSQRFQCVLSPSNAKHTRRFVDTNTSMRPPIPSKRSNRCSF
jgi:hypothetical protein